MNEMEHVKYYGRRARELAEENEKLRAEIAESENEKQKLEKEIKLLEQTDYEWNRLTGHVKELESEIKRKDEALRYIQNFCGDEMIGETDILERIENEMKRSGNDE